MKSDEDAITIQCFIRDEDSVKNFNGHIRSWLEKTGFFNSTETICFVPSDKENLFEVFFMLQDQSDMWEWAGLGEKLSEGHFKIIDDGNLEKMKCAALGWGLASYEFCHFKKQKPKKTAALYIPNHEELNKVSHIIDSVFLVRDLINTPASHMGPAELAGAAKKLAIEYKADFNEIVGDALLKENYPAIHAVGRASAIGREPRLIDFKWGGEKAPKVTLVGKGVCFDTGGLDLKPASNMKLMKKDMGGAAAVLGLASMIMSSNLPVRLRVLIPAVENSVSANALRPSDVVETRSGKTIEIGNTDAEGRVILADALFEADSEDPDLIIDCATLTGAARVALGTDVPALFSSDNRFADMLVKAGEEEQDPLWRLPLFDGYRQQIKGKVADLTNAPEGGYGGAITAALFLQEFVSKDRNWSHIDMMAWNLSARPGRPEGGEAQGIRALFRAIQDYFDL